MLVSMQPHVPSKVKAYSMKHITIIVAFLMGLSSPVAAQDFDKGLAAAEADNYATALKEWRPLAEQGNAQAQWGLGVLYSQGKGVLQDYSKAIRFYKLSATKNNSDAQLGLAIMYQEGLGVIQDYTEAYNWYRRAAKQGSAVAAGALGYNYSKGTHGYLKDNVMAHAWYNIASANGSKAVGILSRNDTTKWYGAKRDETEKEMTPADISKAQAMARECMNSGYTKCRY